MTPEEFIKLIDEEIAEWNELWDIYDENDDRENCKRVTIMRESFEMFKVKVLKRIGGSVN